MRTKMPYVTMSAAFNHCFSAMEGKADVNDVEAPTSSTLAPAKAATLEGCRCRLRPRFRPALDQNLVGAKQRLFTQR